MSKILSYIGLARRAGKVTTGVNACGTLKGAVPLLILCKTASDNTVKDVVKLSKKYHSVIVVSNELTVEELFNKENCKLAAVTEPSLAKEIIKNIENSNGQFELFGGSNN